MTDPALLFFSKRFASSARIEIRTPREVQFDVKAAFNDLNFKLSQMSVDKTVPMEESVTNTEY